MSNKPLRLGVWRYDHVQTLYDGTVQVDGFDVTIESGQIVSDIFERMYREQAFDVAELGLTYYLRSFVNGESPFIALPIFPNRHFRHSAIYVNAASGIESPTDLIGKTIGEAFTYGHDAGIWPKGIMSDEFGLRPEQARWVVGPTIDFPMAPFDWIPFVRPAGVDISIVPPEKHLAAMLETGEIDALISALAPISFLSGAGKVRRLFRDTESVERDYYARTGIYPIMHTVVIRKAFLQEHPEAAQAVYKAFTESKEIARQGILHGRYAQHIESIVPWFDNLVEKQVHAFPEDWWPYGLAANRKTIETFLRYYAEQGLSPRQYKLEELFVPELLES